MNLNTMILIIIVVILIGFIIFTAKRLKYIYRLAAKTALWVVKEEKNKSNEAELLLILGAYLSLERIIKNNFPKVLELLNDKENGELSPLLELNDTDKASFVKRFGY